LILTDRDYIMKSSRAFVSFVRSFKEHRLSNILKFKNFDVYETARSFFLFKMPKIRETLELVLDKPLATPEELTLFEKTEFKDKNQEKMVKEKIEEAKEKRKGMVEKREVRKDKAEKEQDKRKVRSKAERNRAKLRETENQFNEFSQEQKLKRKLVAGKLSKSDYESTLNKIDKKHEYKVKQK
jgi:ATP-dependent RNA helicase DDX55/SPB4